MCSIPATSLYSSAQCTVCGADVLTGVAKLTDVDSVIFENVLYWVNYTNCVT
jgi:hypothetical protein